VNVVDVKSRIIFVSLLMAMPLPLSGYTTLPTKGDKLYQSYECSAFSASCASPICKKLEGNQFRFVLNRTAGEVEHSLYVDGEFSYSNTRVGCSFYSDDEWTCRESAGPNALFKDFDQTSTMKDGVFTYVGTFRKRGGAFDDQISQRFMCAK